MMNSSNELDAVYENIVEGWVRALELRDPEAVGHTRRVLELSLMLARSLNLLDNEGVIQFRWGVMLHEIGKMGIPDAVLFKPGPLGDAETSLMRQEPLLAYQMLTPVAFLRTAAEIPYCMHEHWDGSGYPRGLKGDQIPMSARLVSIVDAWDRLVSDQRDRPGLPPGQASEAIRGKAGSEFDPALVDAFLHLIQG